MSEISGILYSMQERIKGKLVAAGATSRENAVTTHQANLDVQEQNWIHYIAGGMFATVKKTANNLYYVRTLVDTKRMKIGN